MNRHCQQDRLKREEEENNAGLQAAEWRQEDEQVRREANVKKGKVLHSLGPDV